jgi:hypothetical protein
VIEVVGYAVIVIATIAYALYARRTGRQSLPDAIRRLMLHPVGRVVVLAAWAWVGWHLFARGSGAFE